MLKSIKRKYNDEFRKIEVLESNNDDSKKSWNSRKITNNF